MTNLCAVLWQHVNTKQEIHSAKQMHVRTVLTKSDCSMIILALNLILHASLWLFPLEQYKIPTQSCTRASFSSMQKLKLFLSSASFFSHP